MSEAFEGSRILERLAQQGFIDHFYEAVDSDNFALAKKLMQQALIEEDLIDKVLVKMRESDD